MVKFGLHALLFLFSFVEIALAWKQLLVPIRHKLSPPPLWSYQPRPPLRDQDLLTVNLEKAKQAGEISLDNGSTVISFRSSPTQSVEFDVPNNPIVNINRYNLALETQRHFFRVLLRSVLHMFRKKIGTKTFNMVHEDKKFLFQPRKRVALLAIRESLRQSSFRIECWNRLGIPTNLCIPNTIPDWMFVGSVQNDLSDSLLVDQIFLPHDARENEVLFYQVVGPIVADMTVAFYNRTVTDVALKLSRKLPLNPPLLPSSSTSSSSSS